MFETTLSFKIVRIFKMCSNIFNQVFPLTPQCLQRIKDQVGTNTHSGICCVRVWERTTNVECLAELPCGNPPSLQVRKRLLQKNAQGIYLRISFFFVEIGRFWLFGNCKGQFGRYTHKQHQVRTGSCFAVSLLVSDRTETSVVIHLFI